MKLSILIPAYQEERSISEVLARVSAVDLAALGVEREIIVCDDGSRDATADHVTAFAATHPEVRLVRHEQNRGKGRAIRTALEHADGDYVLIQDADLEYEPSDYPALLRPALEDGADVVYGSRFRARAYPKGMAPQNFIANKLLTTTANLLYGSRITDEATCFKLLRTDLIRDLGLTCEGFEFCPEVTAKLGLRKVPIAEVAIEYRARDAAHGKKVRWTDGFEAMWVLVKHRFGHRNGRSS
jgi:glycosyltransferase involved in cell wall biosynthesis